MDDAELLEAVSRRDGKAFEAFVARYGHRLLAFGKRMCGHVEDGEDVFQDTLMAAFEGLAALRDPGAVRTWLFKVAANACRMRRRRQSAHRELPLDPHGAAETAADPPAATPLPDAEIAAAEMQRTIAAALKRLPPEQRLVVLLRDVEELGTRETAEALGLSESAVKMRLHRGRARLREALGENFRLDM